MSQSIVVGVRQLVNRLENATSSERLDALQELQTLTRTEAPLVGECALQKVLDFLKEQGSTEEYQECLDLIDRLIKSKDKGAAITNTNIILSSTGNIELLLDLLEHEDLTVGVMTSQILTELHTTEPFRLEACIQECPDGMNKLLQRLPDRSKEEVRNQAIVLIQQLTMHNEEMKKTVVFNEGFEILFSIITSEGGSIDAGLVVQDCLQICCNLLQGSEICQRFFFGMGVEWVLKLHEFFDPSIVENYSVFSLEVEKGSLWFDQPYRVRCAVLALRALVNALEVTNAKHQKLIAITTSSVVESASFWITRTGPDTIVNVVLSLLSKVVENNPLVAAHVSNMMIKVNSSINGKTIPNGIDIPMINFGWKPLLTDDRKFVTITALLAERYLFSSVSWGSSDTFTKDMEYNTLISDGLSIGCFNILEKIFQADTITCDLIVQFILAPPPPSLEEDISGGELESIRPLGIILLNLLLDSLKIIDKLGKICVEDVKMFEKYTNILSLLFIYGDQAGELSTAISISHTCLLGALGLSGEDPMLPHLLAMAGRAAKIPITGHSLLIALLRLLSSIVNGCNKASRLILQDPAHFFLLDLCSPTSESYGTPTIVQIISCFFLGTCFQALKDPTPGGVNEDLNLTQKSFLGMIDNRVGLTRFNEIVRRPLSSRTSQGQALASELFVSKGFKSFYINQIELIRSSIFSFYTNDTTTESPLAQIINMQKEKILELENNLKFLNNNNGDSNNGNCDKNNDKISINNDNNNDVDINGDDNNESQSARLQELEATLLLVKLENDSLSLIINDFNDNNKNNIENETNHLDCMKEKDDEILALSEELKVFFVFMKSCFYTCIYSYI